MSDILIGAFLAGCIPGLVPLYLGIMRGKERLGGVGLLCCVIGSLLLGIILALIVSAIFTTVILIQTKKGSI